MLLRPFCSATDYSTCSQLIPNEWTFPGCTDDERSAHKTLVLSNMLKCSTYSLVAEDTDTHEPLGLLLARFADTEPAPDRLSEYQAHFDEAFAFLDKGSRDARRAIDMECSVSHVHEVLDAQTQGLIPERNELTLYVVSENARGRGIGTTLRNEFERHLLARGSHSYYLMTDAVCAYDYYERNGFDRIATFTPNANGTGYPNVAYYYQRFLSPEDAAALTAGAAQAGCGHDIVEHGANRESSSSEGDSPQLSLTAAAGGETIPATPISSADSSSHHPRVRYRPFDVERDLESAIDVVPASWRPWDDAYDDAFVHESRYGLFAHLLRTASFLEVAVVDEPNPTGSATHERVVGVLAGRFGPTADKDAPNPKADELEARSKHAMDMHPKGAKWAQCRSACEAANVAMIAQARYRDFIREDNELILFINDPSVRGQGVGRTMLLRFEDYLRSRGAQDYYLFTDTMCTYSYYEKHGFTRVALCNDVEADEDITIYLGAKSYAKSRSEHPAPNGERPFEEFVYMRNVPSLAREV